MSSDTKERAKNCWQSILSNYMDTVFLSGKHTACPLCGGKDRFRFEPASDNGSYICSHCGAGSGIHLLANFLHVTHAEAWFKVELVIGSATATKQQPQVDREKRIKDILEFARPAIENDFVWCYLHGRGINYSDTTLLRAPDRMIGRFALGNKLVGLHVTTITEDGKKGERKMYGLREGGLNGSAIRLHSLKDKATLLVAEGIETALSASQIFGIPAWACGSAGLLEKVEIPEQISHVVIAGDRDESFTGQASAYVLAKRLTNLGKSCRVCISEQVGDWNDVLQAQKNSI